MVIKPRLQFSLKDRQSVLTTSLFITNSAQHHAFWRFCAGFFYIQSLLYDFFPACDYLGERMASLFGITSAKYQYAIDEYYRMKREVCCRDVL